MHPNMKIKHITSHDTDILNTYICTKNKPQPSGVIIYGWFENKEKQEKLPMFASSNSPRG